MHIPPPWTGAEQRAAFLRTVADRPSALLLDYDGTLAPFRRERLHATPYGGVLDRLDRLASLPRVHLVLVTGRPARELKHLLSSRPLEIWGSHGREQLTASGQYHMDSLAPGQTRALSSIHDDLRAGLPHDLPVEALERKPASLAIHWRALPQPQQQDLAAHIRHLYAERAEPEGLQLLSFDGGLEIRSGTIHKGTVVERILQKDAAGSAGELPVAYLGDDTTDEDAFHALARRGVTVLVSAQPRPTAAHYWLRPPEELLAFLDDWIAAAQGGQS